MGKAEKFLRRQVEKMSSALHAEAKQKLGTRHIRHESPESLD